MGIKEELKARIEKNAVKIPDLTWTDSSGNVHTDTILLKRSRLPLVGDWGRIYPPVNEDDSINWTNLIFGGRQNFFKMLLIFLILGLVFYQFVSLLGVSHEYLNGENYIIISKPLFNKYCSTTTLQESFGSLDGNITVFKEPEVG